MSAEALAGIFMGIDDSDTIRSAIAKGDFSAVDASGLDDYERRLLSDAATETLPDVAGFAFAPGQKVSVWAPYHYVTTQYITRNMTNPGTQAAFLDWQNSSMIDPIG